ncbi:hypothetical protein DH2020_044845 [Rehmannia glutinosa]|uniref:CBS domain-containing protein n=1 Tax=Rehmannia glutinosa TaxID=99300 RepID=A0ABR0UGX0_REHGL
MDSIVFADLRPVFPLSGAISTVHGNSLPCILTYYSRSPLPKPAVARSSLSSGPRRRRRFSEFRRPDALSFATSGTTNSVPPHEGVYTVGDFMTRREHLQVVRPTTTVDEALEILVEKRITGFPVVDDDGKLVGVVSDYDLLALDSISEKRAFVSATGPLIRQLIDNFFSLHMLEKGRRKNDTGTFNEIQKLLSKTNGKVVGDLMTPSPLVVRENTNLEDAVRLLLKTKYRRLPVVDGEGKLIGIITRGDIVRGALMIKQATEKM